VAFLFNKASLASFVLYFLKERDEKEGGERSECTCPGCPSQSRGLETNDYYSIYEDMPDVGRPVMGLRCTALLVCTRARPRGGPRPARVGSTAAPTDRAAFETVPRRAAVPGVVACQRVQ